MTATDASQPRQPAVSVVIPTRDRPAHLARLADSLRGQTLVEWEAVVVDDGSDPAHLAAAQALAAADRRMVVMQREGRAGANRCRNQGLAAARAALVVFFDDDDLLSPACLEARVAAMRADPGIDLAVFPYQRFREDPGDLPGGAGPGRSPSPLDSFLRLAPPWHTGGPVWRRDFLARVGGWDERLASWQDWEFGIRALLRHPRLAWVDGPAFHVRVASALHPNISSSGRAVGNVRSWAIGVEAVADELERCGELDLRRRALLGPLYLFVAKRLVEVGLAGEGRALWARCMARRFPPGAAGPLGSLLLRAAQAPRAQPAIERLLEKALASERLTAALAWLHRPAAAAGSRASSSR